MAEILFKYVFLNCEKIEVIPFYMFLNTGHEVQQGNQWMNPCRVNIEILVVWGQCGVVS